MRFKDFMRPIFEKYRKSGEDGNLNYIIPMKDQQGDVKVVVEYSEQTNTHTITSQIGKIDDKNNTYIINSLEEVINDYLKSIDGKVEKIIFNNPLIGKSLKRRLPGGDIKKDGNDFVYIVNRDAAYAYQNQVTGGTGES